MELIIFLGRTHVLISLVVYSIISKYVHIDKPVIYVIPLLIFATLLPDIDHKNSKIGKFSSLHEVLDHRGITHTLAALVVLSLPVLLLGGTEYFLVFWIGYSLHLIGDCFNIVGVKLLYPFSNRRVSLGLVKVGSSEENFICLLGILYLSKLITGL